MIARRRAALAAAPLTLALVAGAAACGRKAPEGGSTKSAGTEKAGSSSSLPDDVAALEKAVAPSSAGVATATAAPGVLLATGELVPPVRSELVARVTGRVGKVMVDEGARVAAGQPLLEIESDYLKLEAARAEAEAARAGAALADAERDYVRKKELLGKGSVAQAAFERSESAFEQARAARQSAQAGLDLAHQRLADAVLRAPIDGVVLERRVDVGERLSEGTVTFVLVQTAPLKLRFRVPERDLGAVAAGAPVRAKVDPYPGETFAGKVSVVVPVIDPASRTFAVEALFDNRDGRLRPGLFARVELDVAASRR